MSSHIGIIGTSPLPDLMRRIAEHIRLPAHTFDSWPPTRDSLAGFRAVVLCPAEEEARRMADYVTRLRLDLGFEGTVVIVSFAPAARLEGGAWARPAYCSHLRLPLMVERAAELLAGAEPLRAEEFARVREYLAARRVARLAGEVRHDCENRFALALSNLRSLELLSHYVEPDLVHVSRVYGGVRRVLTREKVRGARSDLARLFRAARMWDAARSREVLRAVGQCWLKVGHWLDLSEGANSVTAAGCAELFGHARQAQQALRDILALLTRLKEAAQAVTDYAEQNLISR